MLVRFLDVFDEPIGDRNILQVPSLGDSVLIIVNGTGMRLEVTKVVWTPDWSTHSDPITALITLEKI